MNPIDKIKQLASVQMQRDQMGQFVEELKVSAKDSRRSHERRWYDNNFFDDGYHFRYLSRQTNKIVDMSERANIYSPLRAIPKASKQIRGVSNLLMSPRYVPVVYPEKIFKGNYTSPEEAQMAALNAKNIAKRQGHWVTEEWKRMSMLEQLAFMIILTAKHGVSYMEIWPDSIKEQLKSQVFDAFDIYLLGNLNSIYDSPYIIKSTPRLISEIKADENFEEKQRNRISPDNKMASSEVKQAYMASRFGSEWQNDVSTSVIQNEAFIKEYVNEDVKVRASMQENADEVLNGKKDGDMIIRHVFTAGNTWLKDEYLTLPEYPFVDFRMEPGPIYQVPLIERFIPANKSLDMAVSRLETFFHTMNVGVWMKRQGEQMNISNQAGGQIVEYNSTPPVQGNISSPSAMSFPFLGFLSSLIEEQGVTTSTLGKIPTGVRANAAIESLKESEYASLFIAQERLKDTVGRIAKMMLMYADDYYVQPQTVYMMEKGEPTYFDVIGKSALAKRKDLGVMDGVPEGVVPLSKDLVVEIEVEQGMAFTEEGRKKRAKEVMDSLVPYVKEGFISPDAFKLMLQNWLETWQYGAVGDIMDAMDSTSQTERLAEDRVTQMKVALLEALKEAGEIGPEAQQKRIEENKLGVVEALKDVGLTGGLNKGNEDKGPSRSLSFKDLPPEGKIQLAAQAGITLSPEEVQSDEAAELVMKAQEMKLKMAEHQMKMGQEQDKMVVSEAKHTQQMKASKESLKKTPVKGKKVGANG